MFYFVRRIANYLLTNKIPPKVIHPDLYPELRRIRPKPVPEQTDVNRPQIPRKTDAHQPQISREMDFHSYPLPPPKNSMRYMLNLPTETLMQQPPERNFVREEEPTSDIETQSSGDFHYIDSEAMKLPEPKPAPKPAHRLSRPPHKFPSFTTNDDKAAQKFIQNKMDSDKIKLEYPPVREYHGSDPPILLPRLRINSPENRRKLIQRNPDEDYVFMGGTTAFPGVPEPSNATKRSSAACPPAGKSCYIG